MPLNPFVLMHFAAILSVAALALRDQFKLRAVLNGSAASATATLGAGTRFIAWPVADLDKRIQGRQASKHAVVRLISFDMAMKVARA